ncbi:hypothetical protein ASE75_06610 [Sphingomonas sp. Leaf17]|uniref:SPOR domain-containing protein n=1 Tax=Sphingomonas sp. Leaf17 TaxID=1735683 RepID=UPI0006F33D78|nr:SPOR domain-containing protein [Sphingomonas sp. Leaf17]KQM65893.1 hypothetical protein ASE75_06610 [Sphingomonas sp. Leaf17]
MRSSVKALSLAFALVACSGGRDGQASGLRVGSGGAYMATGLSSWYGEELAGNRTASGERFDPRGITAAHRTLPLGSLAEVTDLNTGRSIVVRVNDRGPHRDDRLIDLSQGAARLLGTDRRSVASVRVRTAISGATVSARSLVPDITPAAVSIPKSVSGRYSVQVGSFSSQPRAQALADRIDASVRRDGALYRVILGPFEDARSAQRARDAVVGRGYGDARILPRD